jgi:hypothetical protein
MKPNFLLNSFARVVLPEFGGPKIRIFAALLGAWFEILYFSNVFQFLIILYVYCYVLNAFVLIVILD